MINLVYTRLTFSSHFTHEVIYVMARLTDEQWAEIVELRNKGVSFKELKAKFDISRQAIHKRLKHSTPNEVMTQVAQVLNDKLHDQMMNADNFDVQTRTEINLFISKNNFIVNAIVNLHEQGIHMTGLSMQFIIKALSANNITLDDLERYVALQDSVIGQIERLSKIYGMGTAQSQVNVQMNQFNSNNSQNHDKKDKIVKLHWHTSQDSRDQAIAKDAMNENIGLGMVDKPNQSQ